MLILVATGTVLIFAVHVRTAGPSSLCPGGPEEWYDKWYNNSHPTMYDEDFEPIPKDAQYICPPDKGRLLVRCTSDDNGRTPDTSFTGMLYDYFNDIEVECSSQNGSACYPVGEGAYCLDYAIQIGCDCTNPQVPPANCGSATTPKTLTNCSCPARNAPRRNSAPPCSSKMELHVLALFVVLVLWKH